jgi:hypothetical protein
MLQPRRLGELEACGSDVRTSHADTGDGAVGSRDLHVTSRATIGDATDGGLQGSGSVGTGGIQGIRNLSCSITLDLVDGDGSRLLYRSVDVVHHTRREHTARVGTQLGAQIDGLVGTVLDDDFEEVELGTLGLHESSGSADVAGLGAVLDVQSEYWLRITVKRWEISHFSSPNK